MQLEQRTLGRTGLKVSVVGLGCGGNSRLGLSNGHSEAHAADVVRAALDIGVTLVDTARAYGTERAVGQALQGRRRDQVVLSSKSPYLDGENQLLTAQAFAENIDASLRELGVETIDIYFIHGLRAQFYAASCERFLPVLEQARQAGKLRFIGVTEAFESDTRHDMLSQAVQDGWDALMVGFNLINPSARERVLAANGTGSGTLGMFAVRRALIDDSWLRMLLRRLAAEGALDSALAESPDLLETLGLRGVCESLSEAAYRFCAYQPGLDCVLSGTSSPGHLRENLSAVQRGPLPATALERLSQLFGNVDSVSGQVKS